MPYVVLAARLAFQPVDPADPKMPTGAEELVDRGGFVPDYAPTGLINALDAAGLIVWTEQERPDLRPVGTEPEAPRTPDQPVVLPTNPNSPLMPIGDVVVTDTPADPVVVDVPPADEQQPDRQVPALPKASDSKETWENYAQLPVIGMSQGEAEAMNKTDLMAEVKARYAAATA